MKSIDLIDSHCHLHEIADNLTPTHQKWLSDGADRTVQSVIDAAKSADVNRIICASVTAADSALALQVAADHPDVYAFVGIHPHEAKDHMDGAVRRSFAKLVGGTKNVGIGECGLDYYYNHSEKADQESVLRFQIELALEHDLPISFHVRDAFADFWPIFDSYTGVRGVLHSFTDDLHNLEKALERGLMIGVNGIATFSQEEARRVIYRTIPQQSLLLETDAPYLTPAPHRGTMCESKHIRVIAEFMSELRGESLEAVAALTTDNAIRLFRLENYDN